MKKNYEKPIITLQPFKDNEYVAACWTVWCNVPYGTGYIETNGKPGYQSGGWGQQGDTHLGTGSGCQTTHTASGIDAAGPSANAMWQPAGGGDPYPVFYWYARVHGNQSVHFSKVEDAQWEPNPNAS